LQCFVLEHNTVITTGTMKFPCHSFLFISGYMLLVFETRMLKEIVGPRWKEMKLRTLRTFIICTLHLVFFRVSNQGRLDGKDM